MTLKALRVNLGWTQAVMADKAGLSHSVIRQAEDNKPIRATTAKALADVLSKEYGREIKPTDLEGLNIQ
jgi:transcriptional regulator with XRE-family HTH domain